MLFKLRLKTNPNYYEPRCKSITSIHLIPSNDSGQRRRVPSSWPSIFVADARRGDKSHPAHTVANPDERPPRQRQQRRTPRDEPLWLRQLLHDKCLRWWPRRTLQQRRTPHDEPLLLHTSCATSSSGEEAERESKRHRLDRGEALRLFFFLSRYWNWDRFNGERGSWQQPLI